MMRPLHIIMPMAGEGSRFVKEGCLTPKPLIMLHGQPLFLHAINSLSGLDVPMKYSFIVRQEHIDNYQIDSELKAIFPTANVVSVKQTTRGAVETCLMAESFIAAEDAVIVLDCDLEFSSNGLCQYIKKVLSKDISVVNGGALVSFNSQDARYSYAEIDAENRVIRTAEKEVISTHALCGAYFFSIARDFLSVAHQLLNDATCKKPEFYLSLLYNYLLSENQDVRLFPMEKYCSYGTPEELKRYL